MNTVKGLTVALEQPINQEYAEELCKLFSMMRGVASVSFSEDNFNDQMNREMVRSEFKRKLIDSILK